MNALVVFDDGLGGGSALYAGGSFTRAGGVAASRIAKWDGAAWSAVGSLAGGAAGVSTLAVFDDGSGGGPTLYAGGLFSTAGGAKEIARWDGTAWSALDSEWMSGGVHALEVFDDRSGGGPALYVGGNFTTAGGVGADYLAKWDGASWSAVGPGIGGTVDALTVFDDGSGTGPALYVGGGFITAGGAPASRMAKWDGASWSALGGGMSGNVHALAVFDDGSGGGASLYAGGSFTFAGGERVANIAKWDGTRWSGLAGGMPFAPPGQNPRVDALTVFDDGSGDGPALYAGGTFSTAGGVGANNIAKWDGDAWFPLGAGTGGVAVNPWVRALTGFNDGSGEALISGGGFTRAGEVEANRIAKWGFPPECYADCDCSGALDFFDFLCFQNLFATGDPDADCDESGTHDFFDFLCFQNAFAAGCP